MGLGIRVYVGDHRVVCPGSLSRSLMLPSAPSSLPASPPATTPQVCPANWQEGSATIKPNVKDSKDYFLQQ